MKAFEAQIIIDVNERQLHLLIYALENTIIDQDGKDAIRKRELSEILTELNKLDKR